MVSKKILKPIKAKDLLYPKDYLEFDLKLPLCSGYSIASDFIFNTGKYNKLLYEEESFPHIINKKGFEIITKIYDEAGKSLFKDDALKKLKQIPEEYINPPIHISSYNFNSNLGFHNDKLMTMLSMHSPLNITLDSMVPYACFFNSYSVSESFSKFFLFFSRVPIFIKYESNYIVMNLWSLFRPIDWIPLNSFFKTDYDLFEKTLDNPKNKGMPGWELYQKVQKIRKLFLQYTNRHVATGNRVYDTQESKNNFLIF